MASEDCFTRPTCVDAIMPFTEEKYTTSQSIDHLRTSRPTSSSATTATQWLIMESNPMLKIVGKRGLP